MNTFFLVIARENEHSNTEKRDKLRNDLSAEEKPECLWKFESEEKPSKILRFIHPKIADEFSYCLIWKESFAKLQPWYYPYPEELRMKVMDLRDEGELTFESLLDYCYAILSRQEGAIPERAVPKGSTLPVEPRDAHL